MQLSIDSVELSIDNRLCNLMLINTETEEVLMLTKDFKTQETYTEWNEQSNSMYNALEKAALDGNTLTITLSAEGAKFFNVDEFVADIPCTKNDHAQFLKCLTAIFDKNLNISKKDFIYIPAPTIEYQNIKYLNLSSKGLINPPEDLSKYIQLEELSLMNNPELDLEQTCTLLKNISGLKKLSLSLYGKFPVHLADLVNLEELHMDGYADFTTIPATIGQLKKLRYFFIQSDKEIILPKHFSSLTGLENLIVRAPKWSLPEGFYNMTKLQELDLLPCDILEFPVEMSNMTSLERIYLGINDERDYEKIFTIFSKITSLRKLEINVIHLPQSISLCTQLEELVIYGDQKLEGGLIFPESFSALISLQKLQLFQCNILTIPDSFKNLSSLKELSLVECAMPSLPLSIALLPALEQLTITESETLAELPDELVNSRSLKSLNLYYLNTIKAIPEAYVKLLDQIDINIRDCPQLKQIPERWLNKIKFE